MAFVKTVTGASKARDLMTVAVRINNRYSVQQFATLLVYLFTAFTHVLLYEQFIFRCVMFYLTVLSGSLSPRHGASSGCGRRNGLQLWRVAANTLNKQSRTDDKGWSLILGVGRGANNSSP
jgi:hypothetical protein